MIRSRIGYARSSTPVEQQAPHASTLADALVVGSAALAVPAGGEHPAPPALASQLSDAGSAHSEGGGSYSPTAADADADEVAAAAGSSAAAVASSRPASRGGQEPARSSRPISRQGSASGASPAAGAQLQHEASGGDPQHLTALQQHVAQLNIRLELPSTAGDRAGRAAAPALAYASDSDDSRRSTSVGDGGQGQGVGVGNGACPAACCLHARPRLPACPCY